MPPNGLASGKKVAHARRYFEQHGPARKKNRNYSLQNPLTIRCCFNRKICWYLNFFSVTHALKTIPGLHTNTKIKSFDLVSGAQAMEFEKQNTYVQYKNTKNKGDIPINMVHSTQQHHGFETATKPQSAQHTRGNLTLRVPFDVYIPEKTNFEAEFLDISESDNVERRGYGNSSTRYFQSHDFRCVPSLVRRKKTAL